MIMKDWMLLCVVIFLEAASVSAQENPILLDFEHVLDLAFTHDPGLGASADAVRIGESAVKEANADFFPRLNGYSSYTRTSLESGIEIFNPVSMSSQSIDFFPKNRYDFGVLLTQEIYTFGRRPARKRAAEKSLAIRKLERQEYRQKLYDNVSRAFAAVLLQKKNMDIQAENLKRAESRLAIVKARVAEGVATDYDLVRAELHLAVYQKDHNRADGDFQKAKARLKDLIAWNRDYDFVPVGEISEIEAVLPDSAVPGSDNRIEVKKLKLMYEAQNLQVGMNRSAYFPDLSGFAKYDWQNGYQPDIDMIKGAWSAGLSLSWLIFDGGGRKQRIHQARLQTEKTEKLLEDAESRIKAEREAAESGLAVAARDLELARRSLHLAEKGLDIAEGQYEQGILGIGDLLDLEIERGEAEKALNLAEYNLLTARLDFKKAVSSYPELP
jgi:outer membrane protein